MATARYYNEDKSEGGTLHIYGVPARDLSDEEYEALPKYLQKQVDASPLYLKSNPNPEPKAANKPGGDKATGEEK
jgi:hypothetical protein